MNSPLINLQKALTAFQGYIINFEIKVNLKKDKDKRLNEKEITDILDSYMKMEKEDLTKSEKPNISTKYENSDNITDTLIWSTPVMSRIIEISFDKREPIKFEKVLEKMKWGLERDKELLDRKLCSCQ